MACRGAVNSFSKAVILKHVLDILKKVDGKPIITCSGIKIFNNLPLEIKNVADNQKKFKTALKKFLYTYSFYTLEEYFSQL